MSRDASEAMMNTVAEDTKVVVSVSHVPVVLLSVCIHKKISHARHTDCSVPYP